MDDQGGAPVQAGGRLEFVAEVDRVDVIDAGEPVDRGVDGVLLAPCPALSSSLPPMVIDEQSTRGPARG